MPDNAFDPKDTPTPAHAMPGNKRAAHTPHASPGESLHAAQRKLDELLQYVLYYIAARMDHIRAMVRQRVAILAGIAVAVLAGAGAIVTAVVLLCEGICDGLAELTGHRWIGELLTAGLLVAIVAVSATVILNRMFGARSRKTVMRYEAMRRRQQREFHRDVQHSTEGAAQKSPMSNPGPERRQP
jgi:hypothetical protein